MKLTQDLTEGYDPIDSKEAILCLKHARYAEKTKFGTPPADLLIEHLQRINNTSTDTQVNIAGVKGGRLIVSFPCTQTAQDVITDMNAKFEEFPCYDRKISAHKGFEKAYASVSNDILRAVWKSMSLGYKNVYVTGYSLGGALSTICALDLSSMFRLTHISAGSPRVGDGRFAKLYNELVKRNVRLVHRADCYTTVPLKELGFFGRNFVHVGNLVHFDKDELVSRPPRPWYSEAGRWIVKKVTSILGSPLDTSTAPDHAIKNYIEALERL